MNKREITISVLALVIMSIIALILYNTNPAITGFAVYENSNSSAFGEGTFSNTIYNGSAIILSGDNLTGTYTSRIFDAGNDANWNNLSFTSQTPTAKSIYGVDGGGEVWKSFDNGQTWTQAKENYGRSSDTQGMFSESENLYIITTSNKEVWKSTDSGISWAVINDTFADSGVLLGESASSGDLFIADASGDVYISQDQGQTWTKKGDFNGGATNNGKGMAINSTNAVFIVDGSGAVFVSLDSGQNWQEQSSGYGGGSGTDDLELDSNGNLYILNNKEIHKSTDQGQTWTIINDSFTPYSGNGDRMLIDSKDNFFVADGAGRIFLSQDYGITWQEKGDMNAGAGSTPWGLTEFIQNTNLSIQIKNCTQSDCSDGTWQTVSLDNINLQSRYFQYKIQFATPLTGISPLVESVTIDYDLINQPPIINLIEPQDGTTYGYNESIALKFSALDIDGNLDSCYYQIDSNPLVLIPLCQNITFNVPEDGNYNLTLYANDTLEEESQSSASFSVQIGAPTILLNSPKNNKYLNYNNITFTYTPTDIDLETCELWGDFNSNWQKNQTDYSPSSESQNTFQLILNEGTYKWNIRCNDSVGNSAFNGNKTFIIDTTKPEITITQPTGEKTSRTNIPLTFSINDSSQTSCKYNVKWSTGVIAIENTTIANCSSLTFSVSADGEYILNLFSNDSAGNFNNHSTQFTIDTSTPVSTPASTGSSGGGGGGGGAFILAKANKTNITSIEVKNLGSIIANPGEKRTIPIEVKNTGNIFLNKCRITSSQKEWIKTSEIKNIAEGEITEFIIELNIPEDANQKTADNFSLELFCAEKTEAVPLKITILNPSIKIKIEKISSSDKEELQINYSINSDSNTKTELTFEIYDSNEKMLSKITKIIDIKKGESKHTQTIEIKNAADGMLSIKIIKQNGEELIKEYFLYDNKFSGYAALNFLGKTSTYIGLIVLIFLFLAILIIIRIIKKRK